MKYSEVKAKLKGFGTEIGAHKYIYGTLGVGVIVGIFLRVFKHSEWLHFELDQARDLFVVYDMIHNDIVPLLGPYARGSELYLGPIFYYFQAIPAFLLDLAPHVVAWPDLLFSILFIPLIYLFARLFFPRSVSVMLALLAATSLFLVTYGRFAWNPNALPFWTTLAMYGLLRAREYNSFSVTWFLVMVGSAAVAMQLHFIAFLVIPLTVASYMILTRLRVPWRSVLLGIALVSLLYLPMLISEYQTRGANSYALVSTIFSKNEKDENHTIAEKMFRGAQETATYNWVIFSSDQFGGDPVRTKQDTDGRVFLLCDADCKERFPHHILAIGSFVIMIGFFIWQFTTLYRQQSLSIKKKMHYQRALLILLWLLWSGVFLTLLAYQISPRFYLLVAPALLIVFGYALEFLWHRWGRAGRWLTVTLVSALIIWNLVNTSHYFHVLSLASENTTQPQWRDLIVNRGDFITLGQMRSIAQYIGGAEQNETDLLIVGDNRYARALYYLTTIENGEDRVMCYIKRGGFEPAQVSGHIYYVLVRTKSSSQINDEMRSAHEITDQKSFGTLTLYKLMPRSGVPTELQQPQGCFVR